MLGFLISAMYVTKLSPTWGFTFCLTFLLMFLSSMVSMTKATYHDKFLDSLAVHEPHKSYKDIKDNVVNKHIKKVINAKKTKSFGVKNHKVNSETKKKVYKELPKLE